LFLIVNWFRGALLITKWIDNPLEVLSLSEMKTADLRAVELGCSSLTLMESAGQAVADAVQETYPYGNVLVLCGPGNNGGDGFVAARILRGYGRTVRLGCSLDIEALRGDAYTNALRWKSEVYKLENSIFEGMDIVIDALFGAGLNKPIVGQEKSVIEIINQTKLPCVSIDVPSGVDGDTGKVHGVAPIANICVSFFRKKRCHLLYPGRSFCRDIRIADIGIPSAVLSELAPKIQINHPSSWIEEFPKVEVTEHKYSRGHAIVVGGDKLTGAARLAGRAALRIGAGLVTIASPIKSAYIYRISSPSIMVSDINNTEEFSELIVDKRVTAVLVGPGNGINKNTFDYALKAIETNRCVIDADALTVFSEAPNLFFDALSNTTAGVSVLTPHEGEFYKVFSSFSINDKELSKIELAINASLHNAVIVFKGPDTVISSPDGRVNINNNSPPDLATAGSGDVLSGIILGLIAQGMPSFEAASAGVWIHGECANEFGPGLIAEDISDIIPIVLRNYIFKSL